LQNPSLRYAKRGGVWAFDDVSFVSTPPNTNTGFAGSNERLLPEYKHKSTKSHQLQDGDIMEFRKGTTGELEATYQFDFREKKWVKL
jgi:hypothetical protein